MYLKVFINNNFFLQKYLRQNGTKPIKAKKTTKKTHHNQTLHTNNNVSKQTNQSKHKKNLLCNAIEVYKDSFKTQQV